MVTFPASGGSGEPRSIPPSFRLDGVEVVRFTVGKEEHQQVPLDLDLAHALDAIRFIPYQSYSPRPGEISFESAVERAEAVGFPVDQSRIVERAEYWLFPVFQIGTLGVSVWRDGRVTEIGSYLAESLDDWEWALERGFLEDTVTLVVDEVIERRSAEKLLAAFRIGAREMNERLASLPAAFEISDHQMHRYSLSQLRKDGGRSLRWHVAYPNRRRVP